MSAEAQAAFSILREQGLSDRDEVFLEPHAFSVQERIENPEIRALHVMEG